MRPRYFQRTHLNVLLGSAVLAALVFGFASCSDEEDDGGAIQSDNIAFTHGTASATVTAEETANYNYYRGFSTTGTSHYSSSALITIESPALGSTTKDMNGNDLVSNAALGFVFGEHDNSVTVDSSSVKIYTFGIASVRYNASTKKVQWYVSWVKEAPATVFGYNNSTNFTDTLGEASPKDYGEETQIVPTKASGKYWEDTNVALTNGNLVVRIAVTANDDGSYTVKLQNSDGTTTYSTQTIPDSTTDFTKKTQERLGRYLTVYYKQSVKGNIQYYDVSGNPIPADYEDIEG